MSEHIAHGRERSLANLRPYRPGQSGNPAGRPKGIESLAREHTKDALEVLVKALRNPDQRIAVTAAGMILDRGWGKPKQAIEASDEAASLTFLHLVASRAFSERLANDRVKDADVVTVDSTANSDAPVNIMTPALE